MAIDRRLVLAMLALPLAACSGKPSDAEAQRLFLEDNKRIDVGWLFDFENVRRINGFEQDQHYVLQMQFDLVARMGSEEAVETLRRKSDDSFFGRQQLASDIEVLKKDFGIFEKGQRFTKTRPVYARRTEAGWQLAK